MSLFDLIIKYTKFFPEVNLKSTSLNAMKKLGVNEEKRFVGLSLALSLLISMIAALLSLFFNAYFFVIPVFLLSFALTFLFFLKLPEIELKGKVSVMEAELPFTLRNIGMLLDMHVPFQKALRLACQKDSELAKELLFVCKEIESGVSTSKALSKLALKVDSIAFKRAIAHFIFAFEIGEGGKEIRKIGDDLLLIQQHKIRDFASRSAIFGLLFLASTAILPTFFLIYSFLTNSVFNNEINDFTLAFALLIFFPFLSFLILAISRINLPPAMFRVEENNRMTMIVLVLAFAAAFFILILQKPFIYVIFPVFIIILMVLFYSEHKKEKAKEEIEKYLPDAFFAISSLPKSSRIETIFQVIKDANYGELSRQAEISLRQLKANVKTEVVIDDFGKRSNSFITKRACDMLLNILNTNSFSSLTEIAQDILNFFEINRERERTLAMQKYTVVFGGFLIPFIIKITISLLNSTSSVLENKVGLNIGFLSLIIPIYLVIYAILASSYAAEAEAKKSAAAFYFIIICCSSLLIFYFFNF